MKDLTLLPCWGVMLLGFIQLASMKGVKALGYLNLKSYGYLAIWILSHLFYELFFNQKPNQLWLQS